MADQGITTKQAMEMLGYKDPVSIYRLHSAGKILGNRIARQWRWSRLSCEAFLRGEAPTEPEPDPPKPRRKVILGVPVKSYFRRATAPETV